MIKVKFINDTPSSEVFPNNKIKSKISMNLSFFAESSGDKTEKATPKKKEKAREEGQVAKSSELSTAFMFLAVFSGLKAFSSYMFIKMSEVFEFGFVLIPEIHVYFGKDTITDYLSYLFMQVLLISLPIFAVAMVIGVISNVIQVGWHPTTKPLMPKFSKLNPLSGFKRVFSPKALVELVKSVAKFAIIGFAIFNVIKNHTFVLYDFLYMDLLQSAVYIGNVAIDVGINVGGWYLAIALADVIYQRLKHAKDLKMTKQEIKDEYKSMEGNPQIKGQIRQRMREASMRRMMQDVPQADVIITNPTHYAIALKYDASKGEAPIVLAKGVDHLAEKIKGVAKENEIIIVENKPLARTIYATVKIGKEIPPELYQAVAEILAYVYKLKNIA